MCVVCVFACVQAFTRTRFVCRLVLIRGSGCVGVCGVFASTCAECRYVCAVLTCMCVPVPAPLASLTGQSPRRLRGSPPGSGGRLTGADKEAPPPGRAVLASER